MENPNILFAFSLTLFAGLSTGIGSAMAFFTKHTNTKFLSLSLGFSAGVMIYVSFMEILPTAHMTVLSDLNNKQAWWLVTTSFFAGVLLIGIIDKLIPSWENPHELKDIEEMQDGEASMTAANRSANGSGKGLMRMGLFTALAIAIHNFPEGIATFTAALTDPKVGIPIAVAVAIHNIPEGIAVSVPVFFATGDRKKAFLYSFLSGLSEPAGAIIAYLILMPYLNNVVFGAVFAAVAGIMVFISLDELLPAAQKYGRHHLSIYGLILGMMVMAISLLLFL